ncbi:unnamed protein product, partial [Vitis vinifera]
MNCRRYQREEKRLRSHTVAAARYWGRTNLRKPLCSIPPLSSSFKSTKYKLKNGAIQFQEDYSGPQWERIH